MLLAEAAEMPKPAPGSRRKLLAENPSTPSSFRLLQQQTGNNAWKYCNVTQGQALECAYSSGATVTLWTWTDKRLSTSDKKLWLDASEGNKYTVTANNPSVQLQFVIAPIGEDLSL
jgi:hypothetical protein